VVQADVTEELLVSGSRAKVDVDSPFSQLVPLGNSAAVDWLALRAFLRLGQGLASVTAAVIG
jgi:hypothetical protein